MSRTSDESFVSVYVCSVSKGNVAPVLNYLSTVSWKHMREWRYSFTIHDLGTKWRWMVSFASLPPLYPWRKSPGIHRRLNGPQSRSGCCGVTKTNFMELSPSWEPPVVQLLKNFPEFYGTRRFITIFTRALHWSLSCARSIQSIPSHHISLRSILTLSTHLRIGLPSGLFFFLTFLPMSYILFSPIRAGGPLLISCPRLIIQYIFSCSP
jgi:hypothetical protein